MTHPLDSARQALYNISGGSRKSNNVRAAKLTQQQRLEYVQQKEFRNWVTYEKTFGRQVFWLKDLDKCQAAGDVFTYFFKWRADNQKFSEEQLLIIARFLQSLKKPPQGVFNKFKETVFGKPKENLDLSVLTPHEVLRLWQSKEEGGQGIGMLDFWSKVYWPSQLGMTKEEKLSQVAAFAPDFASRIYPLVADENKALEEAGVIVVIVSNGDQELAQAVAPLLGVHPENVTGSHLLYGSNGLSTGVNHTYEVFGDDWHDRPQPGKQLSFHYWAHANHRRLGWDHLDDELIVFAGRDGDSASTDGGMMTYLKSPALGNFMVDTPGEPSRLTKFYSIAATYGWTRGQFFSLEHQPSTKGSMP